MGFLNSVSSSICSDPADDERPGVVAADHLDVLELEADADESFADRGRVLGRRQVDVLPQP